MVAIFDTIRWRQKNFSTYYANRNKLADQKIRDFNTPNIRVENNLNYFLALMVGYGPQTIFWLVMVIISYDSKP